MGFLSFKFVSWINQCSMSISSVSGPEKLKYMNITIEKTVKIRCCWLTIQL